MTVPCGLGDIVIEPILIDVYTQHYGRDQIQDIEVDDLERKKE